MTDSRSALIAGASSGIGLAVAQTLVDMGYRVTVVGRDEEKLKAAAAQLGTAAEAVSADLAEPDAPSQVFDTHMSRHGQLDVLVHCAGAGLFGRLGEQSDKRVDLQIDLNLRSLTRLVSRAAPALQDAGARHGKALVAVISSMVGVIPQPGVVPYAMTKAAQRAFCAGAHTEYAGSGIQFTSICPGIVDTPGSAWDTASVKMPSSDVGAAVRFLLSTSPSCFIPELQLVTSAPFVLPDPV